MSAAAEVGGERGGGEVGGERGMQHGGVERASGGERGATMQRCVERKATVEAERRRHSRSALWWS